jgi:hypothetical protein
MLANLKFGGAPAALLCIGVGLTTASASAVTVEVAKKCEALTAKAYPPREPGNPAAGRAKGTGQSERTYFNECVANGGNMDNHARPKRPE